MGYLLDILTWLSSWKPVSSFYCTSGKLSVQHRETIKGIGWVIELCFKILLLRVLETRVHLPPSIIMRGLCSANVHRILHCGACYENTNCKKKAAFMNRLRNFTLVIIFKYLLCGSWKIF